MHTIIGSGFGLYGYLPALLTYLNEETVLPIYYQEKITLRSELASMSSKVRWVVSRCLSFSNIKRFILEKPMASEPVGADSLQDELIQRKIGFSVAYTLTYARWQSDIQWPTDSDTTITLTWNFMAHHFAYDLHNWKRSHELGGGVLRFFGIHIIAMLAQRGYTEVQTVLIDGRVNGEPEIWQAVFNGVNKPICRVNIDSRSLTQCFNIKTGDNASLLALPEPFALEYTTNNLDKRAALLAKIINNSVVGEKKLQDQQWYALTNRLWRQAENWV